MRLLVLGGTVFLGRHIVEAARVRRHVLTLFNRRRHNPDLFPDVEKLRGDRGGDLRALRERQWDAVIDTSGQVPGVVRASAEQLAGAVKSYTFISTISAYRDFPIAPGIDESWPTHSVVDSATKAPSIQTIGPLKALCEKAVLDVLRGRGLIIRSGLMVGPHDPTGRFTYWLRRVAQGGEVLAPGPPGFRVQIIDVRDLAEWILRMVEGEQTGIYNATGPDRPLTMERLLETCRLESGSDARFTWVDEQFLLESGIAMKLPAWLPDAPGAGAVNCGRAIAAGLTFRPLAETVRDTFVWSRGQPQEGERQAGLTGTREAELLHLWHNKRGTDLGGSPSKSVPRS
jgi:2'-hydroxyisoflavone reductase